MSNELLTPVQGFSQRVEEAWPGSLSLRLGNGARLCRRPAAARGKFEGVASLQRAAAGRGRHSRAPFPSPHRACNSRRMALDRSMFPYVSLAKDKQWQPGPYPGVELMVLHKNESSGGVAVLRKFDAGVTVPAHTHPLAHEI